MLHLAILEETLNNSIEDRIDSMKNSCIAVLQSEENTCKY